MAKFEKARIKDREYIAITAEKDEMKLLLKIINGILAILEACTKNGRNRILRRKGFRNAASLRR